MRIVPLTNGLILILGLLFYKPLSFFVAAMIIFSGITDICFTEKFYEKINVLPKSCRDK